MLTVLDTEREIARRLGSLAAIEQNPFTTTDIRRATREYLDDIAEDDRRFRVGPEVPHWNLIMNDTAISDAVFVLTIFDGATVRFRFGSGNSYAVRNLCNEFT